MKKIIALATLIATAASTAGAQTRNNQTAQNPAPLVDQIEVRVINVDVVVTDRRGNTVKGLKADDFEIYENGKLKPISNFYEVTGEGPAIPPQDAAAPAQPAPAAKVEPIPENQRRRIIFFVDNLSLAPFNRNRVFKQMKDFIANVMRPGDEAMIATFNRSMKVRVPFTRDTVQLQQTLDIIAGESALGVAARSERRSTESQIKDAESYDMALAAARTYAQSIQHDLRQAADSISALMSTIAGVEGKKILVLTSEGFPMQPGKEMFTYLEEHGRTKNWQSSAMLESMSFDSSQLIRNIARTANANNITMYTIHAGGLSATNDSSAENAEPVSFQVSQAALSNSTDSMLMMAEMTGGLASLQTNNFSGAFQKIQRDLDAYYSLGYRAGTERVDRQRSIEVKAKNRAYNVRSRRSFVEKSTHAEMTDKVIANLLYTNKQNDLGIILRINRPQPTDEPDLFRVPVEVQIPMDRLTFLPQGEGIYQGGFDVYVVVGNRDNDMSDVARQTHPITIPTEDMPKAKGRFYTYTLDLLMEKGLNRISVGLIDNVSNETGFARDQVLAQDLR